MGIGFLGVLWAIGKEWMAKETGVMCVCVCVCVIPGFLISIGCVNE